MYLIVPYSNGPKWWWLSSFIIKKMGHGHLFYLGLQDFVEIGETKILAQLFSILLARNFYSKWDYILKHICFCGTKFSWMLKSFNFSSDNLVNYKSLWNSLKYAFSFARKRLWNLCALNFARMGRINILLLPTITFSIPLLVEKHRI